MSWEDTFETWSKKPSKTEIEKCENAESMVRDAISEDEKLSQLDIVIFPQGSYKARTNVRLDSDVDICVLLRNPIFCDYPEGSGPASFGLSDHEFTYSEYKNLVEQALVNKFGRAGVTRGNKAFDVHANSYRIDADVVPAFEHRRYTGEANPDGSFYYLNGIEFRPDNGGRIINWPHQTYNNGVLKNSKVGKKYKKAIRILKRLRNKMQEDGISAAKNVASFLIESLVWNVPDEYFNHDDYTSIIRNVLGYGFNMTLAQEHCDEWGEVNELKYLFKGGQPWTREQAHDFLSAAWDFIGFK